MSDSTSAGGNYFSAGSCSGGGFTGWVCLCGKMFYDLRHFNTHKRMSKSGEHRIKEVWKNGVKDE